MGKQRDDRNFQETLNQPKPATTYNFEAVDAQDELGVNNGEITIEEVKIAIKSLKNNKAAGLDEIPAELLKHSGQAMEEELTILFNKCWQSGAVPEDWRKCAIVKIPKKGNISERTNWRGITLLSLWDKILSNN
uniref:Reverse transcriptase domain-containing protein n=1 Tax=Amphilophus citrinellus TaxID=61819 RepID=A0A3Q0SSH4_AMPCI